MSYIYLIAFYFIISIWLIFNTLTNISRRGKLKGPIIVNQRSINSEIVFGIIFLLISALSFILWYNSFKEIYTYLFENNCINSTLDLFDHQFTNKVKNNFIYFKDFEGIFKLDRYIIARSYLFSSAVYLYITIIAIIRGLQKEQVAYDGVHTVHFSLPWEAVIKYDWEERPSINELIGYNLLLTVKGMDERITLKIKNTDKSVIDEYLSKISIQS